MSHYYELDEDLKENKRKLILYINGQELPFYSNSGIFSNTKIDYGSFIFLKRLLIEGSVDSLLDVGCGYGVLGITLSIFKQCQSVDMVDINPRAIKSCKENIDYYHLNNANCFVSDCLDNVKKTYDRIVINPPIRAGKNVIYKMFEQSFKCLNDKGALYIVIKKDLGALSAIKKLQSIFKNVEVLLKDKGYYVIKSFN